MDVNQLKEETNTLSDVIQWKIEEFEAYTGTTVSEIRLNRINVSTIDSPKDAFILNVDVRVEL